MHAHLKLQHASSEASTMMHGITMVSDVDTLCRRVQMSGQEPHSTIQRAVAGVKQLHADSCLLGCLHRAMMEGARL
jgi:hypothetical protein